MKKTKKKNCIKGKSCGYTCITQSKICRKVLDEKSQPILENRSIDLSKVLGEGSSSWDGKCSKYDKKSKAYQDCMAGRKVGSENEIIGKCSSPNLTEEQRQRCMEENYGKDGTTFGLSSEEIKELSKRLNKKIEENKKKPEKEPDKKPEPKIKPEKLYSPDENELYDNMVAAGLTLNRKYAREMSISIQNYISGEIPSLYKGPEDPDDPRVGYINKLLFTDDYPPASGEQYMYVPRSALKKGKVNLNKITDMSGEEPDYDPEDGNIVVKVVNNSRGKDIGKLDPYNEGETFVAAPAGGYKVVNKVRKKDKNGKTYTVYEVEEE